MSRLLLCFPGAGNGILKFVGLRTRERITNGIAFRSKSLKTPIEVYNIAETINNKLICRLFNSD